MVEDWITLLVEAKRCRKERWHYLTYPYHIVHVRN